jgi:hypothetical protein
VRANWRSGFDFAKGHAAVQRKMGTIRHDSREKAVDRPRLCCVVAKRLRDRRTLSSEARHVEV